jgi:hypothetical protein
VKPVALRVISSIPLRKPLMAGSCALALLGPGSWAQDKAFVPGDTASPIVSEAETAMGYARAPVTLEGRVLFLVRSITAYPAEQRAEAISNRIKAMAADLALPANSLRLIEKGDRINIVGGVSGDRFVMSVFDADADAEGSSRQQLAEAVQRKVAETIVSYREARSPRALLISTGYALLYTFIAAISLFAGHHAFRLLEKAAERRFKPQIEGRQILALKVFQSKQLVRALRSFLKAWHILALLLILYVYLMFCARSFSLEPGAGTAAVRALPKSLVYLGDVVSRCLAESGVFGDLVPLDTLPPEGHTATLLERQSGGNQIAQF